MAAGAELYTMNSGCQCAGEDRGRRY